MKNLQSSLYFILSTWSLLTSILKAFTSPGHHVTQMAKFCMVAPGICGSSVYLLLLLTILLPRILRLLLASDKIYALPVCHHIIIF